MKVQTLTAIVGGSACNAHCPYCISKMTPTCGVKEKSEGHNRRNFDVACHFAEKCGVSTLLLTGKGEPTLYLDDIRDYLAAAHGKFPFIELQTNGILLCPGERDMIPDSLLLDWYRAGLTTVSISIVHFNLEFNASIFTVVSRPHFFWAAVERLHRVGFSVRINCTLLKNYIDSPHKVKELVRQCAEYRVEQVTVREVAHTDYDVERFGTKTVEFGAYSAACAYETNGLCDRTLLMAKAEGNCTELLELPHGGKVLDWQGQNVCLGNCMTETRDPEDIRQLIFYPDGRLRHSWQYEGSVIL